MSVLQFCQYLIELPYLLEFDRLAYISTKSMTKIYGLTGGGNVN